VEAVWVRWELGKWRNSGRNSAIILVVVIMVAFDSRALFDVWDRARESGEEGREV
jgi:hypothetical protein